MFNILLIAFSSMSIITDGDMYEFSRGYSYEMSRCVITELHEIFDYGDESSFLYEANKDSFMIKKNDDTWSVECRLNTRTEIVNGEIITLPHNEMDYAQ